MFMRGVCLVALMSTKTSPDDPLPVPSAELILLGVMTRAYSRRLSKKERALFLEDVTTALDVMAAGRNVHRIRRKEFDAALKHESVKARAWWGQMLGVLLSGLGV